MRRIPLRLASSFAQTDVKKKSNRIRAKLNPTAALKQLSINLKTASSEMQNCASCLSSSHITLIRHLPLLTTLDNYEPNRMIRRANEASHPHRQERRCCFPSDGLGRRIITGKAQAHLWQSASLISLRSASDRQVLIVSDP